MASVSGSTTIHAVQVATTWGTPVAVGAGDKFSGELTYAANETEIVSREIGSGNEMITSATRGNTNPTVSIQMDAGYDNNFDIFLAQFMGTSGAPTEVTGGQGDYLHTLTFNSTLNSKYLSVGTTDTSSTSLEFPTCAVTSVTISTPNVPGIVNASFELLANEIAISSATNTYAVVAAATARSSNEFITAAFDDDFWIDDTSTGALAAGDQLNITSYELTLTRPQSQANEIKGASGNGAPIKDGLFEGTLTITLKELADHTYFTAWNSETKKKCLLNLEGTAIGSGTNRSLKIYIPQMQLIQAPDYGITAPGVNPLTLTFKISKADSNPTGMSSTYPYFTITNLKSASLLA